MKKKRKIKRKVILFGFFIVTIIVIAILLILYITKEPLAKLGYNNTTIKKLKDDGLDTKIDKYHKIIDEAVSKGSFNSRCLSSYIELNEIDNVYKLCDFEYKDDEIKTIINFLDTNSIDKITKYMPNLISYIGYSHFNIDNYDQYITSNINDIGKRISYVNIGLNNPFYKNTKESINLDTNLILVNKHYKLSEDYPPYDLEVVKSSCSSKSDLKLKHDAKVAFEKLCDDAVKNKYKVMAFSGYRSYEYQKNLYKDYLKNNSESYVDTFVARAGHSEHQTGLAIDISDGSGNSIFSTTKEYQWVKDIAHKYGFVIRYTKEFTPITGYKDEAWHIRYVGVDVATYLYQNNITLEEYLLNYKVKIDLN